jgi:hypothetical protein
MIKVNIKIKCDKHLEMKGVLEKCSRIAVDVQYNIC